MLDGGNLTIEGTVRHRLIPRGVLGIAIASVLPLLASAQAPTFLDQGWSKQIRELYYFTPQGSRMIPYAWFMALETPDGKGMFADAEHLRRYGLIPADEPHPLNPDMLPIGFAIDPPRAPESDAALAVSPNPTGSPGQYLGLTCAACHTATVTVEGRPIRIDGGAANFDFDTFYADLATAVTRTLFDPERFQRFASRVLVTGSVTGLPDLQLQFAAFQARMAGEAVIRRPTLISGFGRVDALTQIVNALAATDQSAPPNLRAVDAPTSYPPLWLTPELEFVQWNPIAGSPIGRNGGEVLGVFGTASLSGDPQGWFSSSILLKQLHALETWVADLKPPKWDEGIFGPINKDVTAKGDELFRQFCKGCHNMAPYSRTDPAANFFGKTFIEIGRVPYRSTGTDTVYVESLAQRLVRTNAATAPLLDNKEVVPAAAYFLRTVGAIISRAMDVAGLSEKEKIVIGGFRLRKSATGQPESYSPPSLTDLKASPLAGIWATGPYLHNGSVPTVYELLSPEQERRRVFWTGGRELDRERLGFVSDDAPGRFRFDTSLPGNRNTGHLFPRKGLTHDERMAIIEYLKTQ